SSYEDVEGNAVTDYEIDPFSGLVLLVQPSSKLSVAFSSENSQYVNFGDDVDIQFERTDPFSIGFFIKASNPGTAQVVLSKCDDSFTRGYRVILTATGILVLELRNTINTNRYTINTN